MKTGEGSENGEGDRERGRGERKGKRRGGEKRGMRRVWRIGKGRKGTGRRRGRRGRWREEKTRWPLPKNQMFYCHRQIFKSGHFTLPTFAI